jgi:ubiquitin C-terminal hydrolase
MEPNFNAEIKENLTNIPNLYKKHSLIPVTENKIITDQEFFSILKESSRKGLCGLENKSKTYCYINSTLQCMSHTIEITNSFFNYYKNTSKIDSESK